jgi:hypothetical protein
MRRQSCLSIKNSAMTSVNDCMYTSGPRPSSANGRLYRRYWQGPTRGKHCQDFSGEQIMNGKSVTRQRQVLMGPVFINGTVCGRDKRRMARKTMKRDFPVASPSQCPSLNVQISANHFQLYIFSVNNYEHVVERSQRPSLFAGLRPVSLCLNSK